MLALRRQLPGRLDFGLLFPARRHYADIEQILLKLVLRRRRNVLTAPKGGCQEAARPGVGCPVGQARTVHTAAMKFKMPSTVLGPRVSRQRRPKNLSIGNFPSGRGIPSIVAWDFASTHRYGTLQVEGPALALAGTQLFSGLSSSWDLHFWCLVEVGVEKREASTFVFCCSRESRAARWGLSAPNRTPTIWEGCSNLRKRRMAVSSVTRSTWT